MADADRVAGAGSDVTGQASPSRPVRPGGPLARLRGGGRGWTLLFVAAGWLFMNGFRVVLPVLLPGIKVDFHIGNAEAGVALTVLWLLYAALQFPSGLVADRTGERRVLVASAVLAGASFGAFYVAPAYAWFLFACALFGFGAGLYGTSRDMLLTRTYPRAVNTAFGITFAAGSVGAALLPFVATAVAGRFGWRAAIGSLLPLLVLVGLGLYWAVPGRPAGAGSRDRLAVDETVRQSLAALAEPRVALAGTIMLIYVFSYQGLSSFLPTYLVEVKGLGAGPVAVLFGLLFALGAAVNPVAGHLADRFGERRTVLGLIGLATATLAVLPFLHDRVALYVLVPLLGVRIAIGPILSAFIVRELPDPVQGTGWGFLRTGFFALGATASTVIGLFADAGRFDAGFLLLAGLTGLTAILWLRMPRRAGEADAQV